MLVNFNKFEPTSFSDYPERSSCVVFLNGCEWKCSHCHNKQTWNAVNMINIKDIKQEIIKCFPFISAVVFSGGEPTEQIEPLIELCEFCKEQGMLVGIETNGYYPEHLIQLRKIIDVVLLDVKAPVNNKKKYFDATGKLDSCDYVNKTLNLNLPIEIRIVDTGNVNEIISSLNNKFKIKILKLNETKEKKNV